MLLIIGPSPFFAVFLNTYPIGNGFNSSRILTPSIKTSPLDTTFFSVSNTPASNFVINDFPAPLSPKIATLVPYSIFREMLLTAVKFIPSIEESIVKFLISIKLIL